MKPAGSARAGAAALAVLALAAPAGAEAERGMTMNVPLPAPRHRGPPVEEAVQRRRSARAFGGELTLAELAELLFAAQGETGEVAGRALRTSPSAGATYPFTVYASVHRVSGLEPGVYRYRPDGHLLEPVRAGSAASALRGAALDQRWVETAGAVLVLAADFARTTGRYGERGRRYVYMEAGHISQNVYLQAVSLGLGSVAIGAFDEARAAAALGIGPPEVVVYLHAVGRPAE